MGTGAWRGVAGVVGRGGPGVFPCRSWPGAAVRARGSILPHPAPPSPRSAPGGSGSWSLCLVSAHLARVALLWRGEGGLEAGGERSPAGGRTGPCPEAGLPPEPAPSLVLQARVPSPDLSSRHGRGKAVRPRSAPVYRLCQLCQRSSRICLKARKVWEQRESALGRCAPPSFPSPGAAPSRRVPGICCSPRARPG